MGILRKESNAHVIYEHQTLGKLVAIHKDDQALVKKFWKAKDKTKIYGTVDGFPFVMTDEQETLKIDFSQTETYHISDLQKFN
ncbi:hypothetical protein OAU25_01080 [Crocinitomicaceae bacterium]|nr:hypothetical protein [Crocinitomicaceae bacterium]